jgi:mannose/fructose/N-acetylgalactosamine-specific phosphotransferase system component IID
VIAAALALQGNFWGTLFFIWFAVVAWGTCVTLHQEQQKPVTHPLSDVVDEVWEVKTGYTRWGG